MFLLRSEDDLKEAFLPKFRNSIELPKNLKFPLVVRDYLTWSDPSSPRVHVIFAERDVEKPIGVIFEREPVQTGTSSICDWCHSHGSSQQIGLLTLRVNATRQVGLCICRDLSCREKIGNNLSLSPLVAQKRISRVVSQMSAVVRRFLI